MTTVVDRLRAAGYELPPYQPLPAGAPRVRTLAVGPILYVSGHGPDVVGREPVRGRLGADLTVAEGAEAAERTMLNILATIEHEVGLATTVRVVKLLGMVRSAPGFDRQPDVIDGASRVLLTAFGSQQGMHTRSAVGMAELPMGIPVEIEVQAQLIV